jgi:REP element-mobilizing transposase RayT
MPRPNRSWLPDGSFHVTARGVRREPIFRAASDAQRLLRRVRDVRSLWDLKAYCLMPNHVHFVTTATVANLGRAMGHVTGPYAQWFNRKYGLCGHLFEDRYAAEPIADEAHLYRAIRYVLLNPVRAGLCKHPAEWPWSNYRDFEADPYVMGLIEDVLRSPQGTVPAGDSPQHPF